MSGDVTVVLIDRDAAATPEHLALLLECYPAPCSHDCWHSSCWRIREVQDALAACRADA